MEPTFQSTEKLLGYGRAIVRYKKHDFKDGGIYIDLSYAKDLNEAIDLESKEMIDMMDDTSEEDEDECWRCVSEETEEFSIEKVISCSEEGESWPIELGFIKEV